MSGSFDGWFPGRGLDAVLSAGRALFPSALFPSALFSSGVFNGVPTSPAGVLDAAVRVTADRLQGKRITVRAAGHDVPMNVVDVRSDSDTLRLAQGRVDAVRFVAEDVGWPGVPLSRLVVTWRDLRFAGPMSTAVTAESVRVEVEIAAEVAAALVAAARPGVRVRFAEAPVVSWGRWPGAVETVLAVEDGRVWLTPAAVRVAGARVRLPRGVRPIGVSVPELPTGLRLTSVVTSPAGVRLTGAADDWRDRLSGTPLKELLSLLATAATTMTIGR
ncbi:LmeA family phospholipid-binding protein [Actinokineospora iranica]|uniref:Uncharacterized protein n=1 Tax=Actinokineospora iranica TaxID=1271860 RepID=A0A1G6J1F7_9PSEU|nr:LmeA family phospholipid-binding protein [Actinokineospora iranica]SDC11806.1 hypothetical protein SAMN05216174_101164 [Actinokineospora iranica]